MVLSIFADGLKVGASEAVMEMSSHALDQERVWGLPVDVAMFTNLTQDHLDYHGRWRSILQRRRGCSRVLVLRAARVGRRQRR